jgi:[phosphatase 2A protein]-leucine-carboxy methyltransferase
VDGFLKSCPNQKKQIISLGAGSDTRYFRIAKGKTAPGMVYHEIDFPQNTKQKISTINRSQDLKILIGDMQKQSDVELHSSDYHIHAFDLRDLDPLHATTPPTSLEHIDPSLPTLVISECCLVYLIPRSADAVVKYFAEKLFPSTTPIGIVLYEPTNPFDSFGKVMVSNLAARGIVLQTLKKYGSLETQKERMKFYGFRGGACAKDLNCLHDAWIDDTEKDRISKLEMLDEVEELQLLLKHYCIAWGWRGGEVEDSLWNKWKSMVENTK